MSLIHIHTVCFFITNLKYPGYVGYANTKYSRLILNVVIYRVSMTETSTCASHAIHQGIGVLRR